MRRILLASVAMSLVLAGCGGGGATGDIDDITVSDADTPRLTVPKDFSLDTTTTKVLTQGDGPEVFEGDTVQANYVAVNGRTGKQFDTSFVSDSAPSVTLSAGTTTAGIIKGLVGQKVGSRLLVAMAPSDGFGEDQTQYDLTADDSMVFLFDIVGKYPQGEAQALPTSLPALVVDDEGQPTGFKSTDDTAKKQRAESISVVNQGTGDPVEAGQSLLANYVGQIYGTDTVFAESWTDGPQQPAVMSEGNVLACWNDLLVGQRLGSRVVLVCPPDRAYGDQPPEGGPVKAGDTLIYVVDLLAAY